MIPIEGKLYTRRGNNKLRKLDNVLSANSGRNSLRGIATNLGREIWENIITRYRAGGHVDTGLLLRVFQAQKSQTHAISLSPGLFQVYIGDTEDLNSYTQVESVGTGAQFHYWSLVEFGWGRRGATRADDYTLWYLGFFGRSPFQVEQEFSEIIDTLIPIKHPGFKGAYGFLTSRGSVHAADLQLMPKYIEQLTAIIKRIERQ